MNHLLVIDDRFTVTTGDAHQLVLAVTAGLLVILLGLIVARLVGHIIRILVWVAAVGITVWLISHHASLATNRHQLERFLDATRRLIGG